MKKLILIFISLFNILLICTKFNITASTSNQTKSVVSSQIIKLNDGEYIIEQIFEENHVITTYSNTFTKTGEKKVTKYDANDNVSWVYILSATFTVISGADSSCTSATYSTSINDSNWKFSNGDSYYEKNVAYGLGLFKHKVLFITTQNYNIELTLTCDSYGNLT